MFICTDTKDDRIKIIGKSETVIKKKINKKFKEKFFTPGIFETLPSGKSRVRTALRFTVSVTKYETTKLKIDSKTTKTKVLNRIYVRFILNVNFAYIQKITSSIKDKIQPRIPSKENLIGRLTTFCAAIMSSFACKIDKLSFMQIIEGIRNTIIVRKIINISFESTKFFHTSISAV